MSDNLKLYNAVRTPPKEALKIIKAGRLKDKTDINPMWRLKTLTEQFGPCGIGWRYEITRQWLEQGANDEISAFVNINLFFKHGDAWSEAIPGTGGSSYVAKESAGRLYVSDECYKMALTDAISVACKALGMAADVYWQHDPTKYSGHTAPEAPEAPQGRRKGRRGTSDKVSGGNAPEGQQGPPAGQPAKKWTGFTEKQKLSLFRLFKIKGITDVEGYLMSNFMVPNVDALNEAEARRLVEELKSK